MQDIEQTQKIIPIMVIENIIKNSNQFMLFVRQQGIFKTEDPSDYVVAINNYMNYMMHANNYLTKDDIERVNYINALYNTNVTYSYSTYLDSTLEIIPLKKLYNILNDEEIFKKFMDFENNRDLFPEEMINYLAKLEQYFNYFNQTQLDIPPTMKEKYRQVMSKYSLELKHYQNILDDVVEQDVDPKFMEEVLSEIDLSNDKFTVARGIYVSLCKKISYDVSFMALKQDINNPSAKVIYEEPAKEINSENNKVVCSSWSTIYASILNKVGIDAKLDGNFHKYVVFDCGGTLIKADATNTMQSVEETGNCYYLTDITRIQLGLPTAGFKLAEKSSKNIEYNIEQADIKNNYYQESLKEKYRQLEQQYRSLSNIENITPDTNELLNDLNKIITSSSLAGFEFVKYVSTIIELMKNRIDIQLTHSVIKDISERFKAINILTIKEEEQIRYFISQEKTNIKEVTKEELEQLIENNVIVNISKTPMSIRGIGEQENVK